MTLGLIAIRKVASETQCARMRGESSQVGEQKSTTARIEKDADRELTRRTSDLT